MRGLLLAAVLLASAGALIDVDPMPEEQSLAPMSDASDEELSVVSVDTDAPAPGANDVLTASSEEIKPFDDMGDVEEDDERPGRGTCIDSDPNNCRSWAEAGHCTNNIWPAAIKKKMQTSTVPPKMYVRHACCKSCYGRKAIAQKPKPEPKVLSPKKGWCRDLFKGCKNYRDKNINSDADRKDWCSNPAVGGPAGKCCAACNCPKGQLTCRLTAEQKAEQCEDEPFYSSSGKQYDGCKDYGRRGWCSSTIKLNYKGKPIPVWLYMKETCCKTCKKHTEEEARRRQARDEYRKKVCSTPYNVNGDASYEGIVATCPKGTAVQNTRAFLKPAADMERCLKLRGGCRKCAENRGAQSANRRNNCKEAQQRCKACEKILGNKPKATADLRTPTCTDARGGDKCRAWANQGLCDKYEKMRTTGCCQTCKNTAPMCVDKRGSRNCQRWAKQGLCDTNPMMKSTGCCATCKNTAPKCVDKRGSHNCQRWAKQGLCDTNPMMKSTGCCATCKKMPPTCKDEKGARQCLAWAKQGFCTRYERMRTKGCCSTCKKMPKPGGEVDKANDEEYDENEYSDEEVNEEANVNDEDYTEDDVVAAGEAQEDYNEDDEAEHDEVSEEGYDEAAHDDVNDDEVVEEGYDYDEANEE